MPPPRLSRVAGGLAARQRRGRRAAGARDGRGPASRADRAGNALATALADAARRTAGRRFRPLAGAAVPRRGRPAAAVEPCRIRRSVGAAGLRDGHRPDADVLGRGAPRRLPAGSPRQRGSVTKACRFMAFACSGLSRVRFSAIRVASSGGGR